MSRLHATLIALVLGAVAATGAFAAVKTVRLGQKVPTRKQPVASREIASRQAKLDRWSRSLRQARGKRPPALPKLPRFAPVPSAPAVAAAPSTRYVRSKPVVTYQRPPSPSTTPASTQQTWSGDDAEPDDPGAADDGHDAGSTGGEGD